MVEEDPEEAGAACLIGSGAGERDERAFLVSRLGRA
jgi:hypothetical protein